MGGAESQMEIIGEDIFSGIAIDSCFNRRDTQTRVHTQEARDRTRNVRGSR